MTNAPRIAMQHCFVLSRKSLAISVRNGHRTRKNRCDFGVLRGELPEFALKFPCKPIPPKLLHPLDFKLG